MAMIPVEVGGIEVLFPWLLYELDHATTPSLPARDKVESRPHRHPPVVKTAPTRR